MKPEQGQPCWRLSWHKLMALLREGRRKGAGSCLQGRAHPQLVQRESSQRSPTTHHSKHVRSLFLLGLSPKKAG